MLTDPQDVLALAEIVLPESATAITVTPIDRDANGSNYNLAFTAPPQDSISWVEHLSGSQLNHLYRPTRSADGSPDVLLKTMLGIDDAPEGSRTYNYTARPATGVCNVVVLLNGPDFSTVNIGFEPFSSTW